jgi:nicotinate-nucleotide adenylyltransferase
MALRRVAIYGGTFDPVHNGHIEAARNVAKLFALDEVIFVPACVPPHKRNAGVTSALHRFAMLALATQDDQELRLSTAELEAPETPYTVETIARLRDEHGSNRRLFFIMGTDSWSEITTWRDWQRLLTMCDQIVVTRPGYELRTETLFRERARVADVRGLGEKEILALMNDAVEPRAFFTDAAMIDVSATAIREAARSRDREKLSEMVPASVAAYIEKYGLYTN